VAQFDILPAVEREDSPKGYSESVASGIATQQLGFGTNETHGSQYERQPTTRSVRLSTAAVRTVNRTDLVPWLVGQLSALVHTTPTVLFRPQ